MNKIKSSLLLILPLLIGYESYAQNTTRAQELLSQTKSNIVQNQDTIKANKKNQLQKAQSKALAEKQNIQSKITDKQKQNIKLLQNKNSQITEKKQEYQSKLSPEQLDKKEKIEDHLLKKQKRSKLINQKMKNPGNNSGISNYGPYQGLGSSYTIDAVQKKRGQLGDQFKPTPSN